MKRDFQKLCAGPFDLLVVGGGIYGAWIAYDGALRGLRVALVEKDDWAAGTSSASSKLIHGGLRYLEYAHFRLVRRALDERKRLWQLAPHRMAPLRFVLPVYEHARVGRLRLGLGLRLYDFLGGRRQPVPRHRSLGRDALLDDYPFVDGEGLRGGFTYGDVLTDDARYTLEIVDGAVEAGAVAVNRVVARRLLHEFGRATGAEVEDLETGKVVEVRAGVTANCAGAWSADLVQRSLTGSDFHTRLSKGVHLVMPALPTQDAFILISESHGRVVFLIPWYGKTLLGTTDTDYQAPPDDVGIEAEEIHYLLEQANRVLGSTVWSESDVVSSFAGLRTLPVTLDESPSAVSREWTLREPIEKLVVPVGGKYTSARSDAVAAVDRILQRLDMDWKVSPTFDRPFPWCPPGRFRKWQREAIAEGLGLGLDEEMAVVCTTRFGTRIEKIFERLRKMPKLAARVVPDAPFCLAEITHAVEHEMARSVEDVVRRRVPLMLVSPLAERRLFVVTQIVGKMLGWDDKRKQEEVAALQRTSSDEPS